MTTRRVLKPLTGIRFIAALHVVLFHAASRYLADSPLPLQNIVRSGYVGVSLFFILSGFILTYSYCGNADAHGIRKRAFWTARFARIYPVYALGLLLAGPTFINQSLKLHHSATEMAVVAGSTASLTQAWLPMAACQWNCPGWSLSAEMFFYLAFPFAVPLIRRIPTAKVVWWVGACWMVSLSGPFIYQMLNPDGLSSVTAASKGPWLTALKYTPIVRVPEFVIGVLVGMVFVRGDRSGRWHCQRTPLWAAIAATSTVLILALSSWIPYAVLHNGLLAPLFALLIFGLADTRGRLAAFLSTPVMVVLGEASYALYILHTPISFWMEAIAKRTAWIRVDSPVFPCLVILVSIGSSILVLRFIEEPARELIKRIAAKAPKRETTILTAA